MKEVSTRIAILATYLILLISCTAKPSPIEYGADECARCKMIISDAKFGTEAITTKGKVYKYDSIECLVPAILEKGEDHFSHILVTDFNNANTLINAKTAAYLISKKRPSPMGEYLSAYESMGLAKKAQAAIDGRSYDWSSLKLKFQ